MRRCRHLARRHGNRVASAVPETCLRRTVAGHATRLHPVRRTPPGAGMPTRNTASFQGLAGARGRPRKPVATPTQAAAWWSSTFTTWSDVGRVNPSLVAGARPQARVRVLALRGQRGVAAARQQHRGTLRLEAVLLGRAPVAACRVARQCLRHAGIAHGRRQRTAAVTKSDAAASAVTRAGAGLAFCTTPATMAHLRQCPAPAPLAAAGCASAPPPSTSYSVTRLPASSACRLIRSRRAAYSVRCASSACR